MRTRVAIACLAAGLVWCVGCDQVELKGGPPIGQQARATDWPFAPTAMRIHPFTSIEYDATHNSVVLEARLELLDRVGDMTKGMGEFRFELYRVQARASSMPVQDEMLYVWNVEMTTVEQNQQYYDPITRTYVFRLRMDRVPAPGTAVRLYGQFTDPDGHRLEATANLTITAADSNEVEAPK